jgi:hypothetical protein
MNTPKSQQEIQAKRIEFQKQIVIQQVWSTCLNCEEWDKKVEQCGQFRTRPPLEVLIHGCPHWYGEIPF